MPSFLVQYGWKGAIFMKHIHFPTLALHGVLLVLAQGLLTHYPDAFLLPAIGALVLHLLWCCRSKRPLALSHLLGCAVQGAAFALGIIEVGSRAFGLGGGEFARFFYLLALASSAIIELVVGLFKYFR